MLNAAFAFQVLAGQRAVDIGRGAKIHYLAALFAGPGPQVQQKIAFADNFRIMLDDHDGIGQVAQSLQNANQPMVIAGMQTDTGLIENIQGIDQ